MGGGIRSLITSHKGISRHEDKIQQTTVSVPKETILFLGIFTGEY